jgi:predicted Zn finger-like uncharacterized protein
MRIVCPNCATSYEIETAALGDGRTVRCQRCSETWTARAHALVIAEPVAWDVGAAASSFDDVAGDSTNGIDEIIPPVVEAEAEGPALVSDAPPLAPAIDEGAEPEPREDVETVAARRPHSVRERRRRGARLRRLPLVIVLASLVLAALLVCRGEVVRFAPQTAQLFSAIGLPVNLRGVVFEDLRISGETKDGVPVMVVEGRITNVTRHDVHVPRLRFAVRNDAGLEVYAWTAVPERASLKAGASMPFRSRLASPPADAKDVMVRFFQRRDLVASQ